jgi:16S rRNA (guanine527-N7)-methyltransferase
MDRLGRASTRHPAAYDDRLPRGERQAALGRPLTAAQHESLDRFAGLLQEAGGRLNLTAVRDRTGIERRHLLESLALLALLERSGVAASEAAVVDVGSGGGLPGIPIAIVRPDLRMTLLEATGKKAEFLRGAAKELRLSGTTVLAARAEEAGRNAEHRERYDLALARAVAPLDTLAELALPLLRLGGRLAAVKGSRVDEEAAAAAGAIARCGGRMEQTIPVEAPGSESMSCVLVLKERPTPPELPRRPGMPAKRPLRA